MGCDVSAGGECCPRSARSLAACLAGSNRDLMQHKLFMPGLQHPFGRRGTLAASQRDDRRRAIAALTILRSSIDLSSKYLHHCLMASLPGMACAVPLCKENGLLLLQDCKLMASP